MTGDFELMDARSVKGIINKGGTILKSARSQEFRTELLIMIFLELPIP